MISLLFFRPFKQKIVNVTCILSRHIGNKLINNVNIAFPFDHGETNCVTFLDL